MTLNVATAAKLIGLANRILGQYGSEIKAVLSEIAGDAAGPPPVPVPMPEGENKVSLPPDFDEAYYRELYGDIREAIDAGKISSGAAHYLEWGWKEGRSYKRPATNPGPAPTPESQSRLWEPAAEYSNTRALQNDLLANKFQNAVRVDGKEAHPGFGPFLDYYLSRSGKVLKGKAPSALEEYASAEALLAHLDDIGFSKTTAVFVDGVAVRQGFLEVTSPRYYTAPDGRVKRRS